MQPITEHEMILEWLRAEIQSPRFSQRLRDQMTLQSLNDNIISHADLQNEQENDARKKLMEFRQYLSRGDIFEGFPHHIRWHAQEISKEDFLTKVLYIDYSYWNELSDHTRLPRRAAEKVRQGLRVYNHLNDAFHTIAEQVKAGATFPRLIMVRDAGKTVLLEGHTRATGFALAEEHLPSRLQVICGVSDDLSGWGCY